MRSRAWLGGQPRGLCSSEWRFRMSHEFKRDGSHLAYCPPVEKWDDWVELDPEAWPRRAEKHYSLVPTVCFNCESAFGLLAYVDKKTGGGAKFEGNSMHPGSP